jgi:DNA-binding IscR family transcriptional regulator
MAKIFQKLVRGGILVSAKGRGGGFALARPGHQIMLMQVVEAMEGPQLHAPIRCPARNMIFTNPSGSG